MAQDNPYRPPSTGQDQARPGLATDGLARVWKSRKRYSLVLVLGFLVGLLMVVPLPPLGLAVCVMCLLLPIQLKLGDDGRVGFKSFLRTRWVRPDQIAGIGFLKRRKRGTVHLLPKGRIVFYRYFPEFDDFLATLKRLNPSFQYVEG